MNILSFFRRLIPLAKKNVHIVMYTRAGCHLCDLAWRELTKAQATHGFVLEQRDVDADPQSQAEFGECVPVVTVNGTARFRGSVNPVLLSRLLDAIQKL